MNVVVTPSGGSASQPIAGQCTSNACSAQLSAPVGVDAFAVSLLDSNGHVLSSGSALASIAAGTANTVSIVLGGVAASAAFVLSSPLYSGFPATLTLGLALLDADGNVIGGNTSYAAPFALTLSNANVVSLSTTSLGSPGQTAQLVYNGTAGPSSFTLSATDGALSTGPVHLVQTRGMPAPSFMSMGPVNQSLNLTNVPTSSNYTGEISQLVFDPTDPTHQTFYAIAGPFNHGGIYHGSTGTTNWTPLDNGLVDGEVGGFWVNPQQPAVLVASEIHSGIYYSDNSGQTWQHVYTGLLDENLGGMIFAETGGGNTYLYCACSGQGILESTNGGLTWTVAVQPQSSGIFIEGASGVSSGYAILRNTSSGASQIWSNNGGGQWSEVYNTSQEVAHLAVNPFNDGNVAMVYGAQILSSSNGGETFTTGSSEFVNGLAIQAMTFSPTTNGRLYTASQWFTAYSNDYGNSFTEVQGYWGDMRSIAVFNDGVADACYTTMDQGIIYSANCTTTVNDKVVNASLQNSMTTGVAINSSTAVAMVQDYTLERSTNNGQTWNLPQQPSPGEDGNVAMDPYNPSICIDSMMYGIAASSDSCNTLSFVPGLFWSDYINDWIAFSADQKTAYIVANEPNSTLGVYSSTTPGLASSWAPVSGWPSGASAWPLVYADPVNPNKLFFGVLQGDGYHLFVSMNKGSTWTQVLDQAQIGESVALPTMAVFCNATGQEVVVLSFSAPTYILRSVDGGSTFTQVPFAPTNQSPALAAIRQEQNFGLLQQVNALQFDPGNTTDPALVLTTTYGAYMSPDAGLTWQEIDNNQLTHQFWGTAWYDDHLYMASWGQGILQSSQSY
jgi:hypothetical protein